MNLLSVEEDPDYSPALVYTYDCGLKVQIVRMTDGIRIRPMSADGDYSYICSMYKDNNNSAIQSMLEKVKHAMLHYHDTYGPPERVGILMMEGTNMFGRNMIDEFKQMGYTNCKSIKTPCMNDKEATVMMFFTKGVDQASIA